MENNYTVQVYTADEVKQVNVSPVRRQVEKALRSFNKLVKDNWLTTDEKGDLSNVSWFRHINLQVRGGNLGGEAAITMAVQAAELVRNELGRNGYRVEIIRDPGCYPIVRVMHPSHDSIAILARE